MTALSRFARLLGLPAHQAEDALHSEHAARAVLSRRSFFAASGAMVAGSAFSFAPPVTHECVITGAVYSWANIEISLGGIALKSIVSLEGDLVALDKSGRAIRADCRPVIGRVL